MASPETSFAVALARLWPNGNEKIPGLRAGIIASAPSVFAKYGIDSKMVLAHLMAQISHECGAGHDVVENLNYSAERMTQVWPSRFPTIASAEPYAHNPKALADKVYNGRMENRPGSDDGWNYRGRGATQTTGREGYRRLGEKMGLDLLVNPDLVNDPSRFLECGVADFILCGCLPYAKSDDLVNVTKRLNGGAIGLTERGQWLLKWKEANVAVPTGSPMPTPKPTPAPAPVPAPKKPSLLDLILSLIRAIFGRKNP